MIKENNIMKKILCLLLLAVIVLSCENSSVQDVEDVPIETFRLGKTYALNNLPIDFFDYVPKDSFLMVLPSLKKYTDSITVFPWTNGEQEVVRWNRNVRSNPNGGNISCQLGSYSNIFGNVFSLYYKVSYTYGSDGVDYISSSCLLREEMESVTKLELCNVSDKVFNLRYSQCIGTPCWEEITCDFIGSGEIHGKVGLGGLAVTTGILYKFNFYGNPEEPILRVTKK